MAKGKVEGTISKRKMVELAVGALPEAKPKQLQEHIQKQHGVEMSLQMISSYKSNLKRAGGGGRIPEGASINLRDLAALRQLMDRIGASELQTLIRVLGKPR